MAVRETPRVRAVSPRAEDARAKITEGHAGGVRLGWTRDDCGRARSAWSERRCANAVPQATRTEGSAAHRLLRDFLVPQRARLWASQSRTATFSHPVPRLARSCAAARGCLPRCQDATAPR